MIELRISEAAALSIVEQADYYQQAADLALAQRWEAAVDQAVHTLLTWPERGAAPSENRSGRRRRRRRSLARYDIRRAERYCSFSAKPVVEDYEFSDDRVC